MGAIHCPKTLVKITTTCCVITQKSAVLIYFVAEAWNHTEQTLSRTRAHKMHKIMLYKCDVRHVCVVTKWLPLTSPVPKTMVSVVKICTVPWTDCVLNVVVLLSFTVVLAIQGWLVWVVIIVFIIGHLHFYLHFKLLKGPFLYEFYSHFIAENIFWGKCIFQVEDCQHIVVVL
jgi:hypothetical protein